MGYGYYVLNDGREAGYNVVAKCDGAGCKVVIDRGLGYLCGRMPEGFRDFEDWGCGFYFCGQHLSRHDCPNPQCDVWLDDDVAAGCEKGTHSPDERLCEDHRE